MYESEITKIICNNHGYEYCVANSRFEIIAYSQEVGMYCAIAPSEMIGKNIFDLLPELFGSKQTLLYLMEGRVRNVEIPLVFKEPDHYVNIRIHLREDRESFIILFENITEITKMQHHMVQANNENLLLMTEIEEKNRQLEMFNRHMQKLVDKEVAKNLEKQHMIELQTRHAQMGKMIEMITHQWKQPLSVIQTVCTHMKLQYRLDKLTSATFNTKMENILKQTAYMSDTVKDFQKFFTPSKAKMRFNIKETINSLLQLVKIDYIHANIVVTVEGSDEVWVEGYPNEYNQVILSILHNAKDALLSKEMDDMYIAIHVTQKQGRSLVSIEDNAGGIPETELEHIFEPYVSTKEKGSGLGLYIAKSVIEKNMHGKIWAKNRQKGAVFYILL